MGSTVLHARPVRLWLARQRPAIIDDVSHAHPGDLALALAGQQQDFQCGRLDRSVIIEFFPERRDFAVGKNTLAGCDWIAFYPSARVGGDDFHFHPKGEYRADRGESLVRDYWRLDLSHHRSHVGSADVLGIALAPRGEDVALHQGSGLSPGFVSLLGVLLEVALVKLAEGNLSQAALALGQGIAALSNGGLQLVDDASGVGQVDLAEEVPSCPTADAVHKKERPVTRYLNSQHESLSHTVPIIGGTAIFGPRPPQVKLGQGDLVLGPDGSLPNQSRINCAIEIQLNHPKSS
jgi:hypothetical protein